MQKPIFPIHFWCVGLEWLLCLVISPKMPRTGHDNLSCQPNVCGRHIGFNHKLNFFSAATNLLLSSPDLAQMILRLSLTKLFKIHSSSTTCPIPWEKTTANDWANTHTHTQPCLWLFSYTHTDTHTPVYDWANTHTHLSMTGLTHTHNCLWRV